MEEARQHSAVATGIPLRRIGPADAPLLACVDPDVFDEAIDPSYLAAYLAQPQNMLVVAVDGPLVVGQCQAVVHIHPDQKPALYIDNLGVAAGHRRRGIARRLVSEMMAWGKERGCAEAWVLTEPDNIAARALYESFRGTPVEEPVLYHYDL